MTESEWFAETDAKRLVDEVAPKASPRQWRLFMAGWCRRTWGRYALASVTQLVDAVERCADQGDHGIRLDDIRRGYHGMWGWGVPAAQLLEPRAEQLAEAVRGFCTAVANAASPFASNALEEVEWRRSEQRALASVFRDVHGNLFRPVALSAECRTTTAVQIAQGMYDSRDFSAMPILADALQDAGCDSDVVLSHCRDPQQVHVRGCWVVDLVLGRS